MIARTETEILSFAKELWKTEAFTKPKFEVKVGPDRTDLTVSAMYEAPGLSLAILMKLAEFFDTKNINDDARFSSQGCETCDYGSSYGFTLTVRPEMQE